MFYKLVCVIAENGSVNRLSILIPVGQFFSPLLKTTESVRKMNSNHEHMIYLYGLFSREKKLAKEDVATRP